MLKHRFNRYEYFSDKQINISSYDFNHVIKIEMKKIEMRIRKTLLIVTILLVGFGFKLSAQITASEFFNTIDWGCTESEFVERYSEHISKTKPTTSDGLKSENSVSILIGDKEFYFHVYVDSVSNKLKSLQYANYFVKIKSEALQHFDYIIKDDLKELFGKPTFETTYRGKIDESSSSVKVWLKNDYAIKLEQNISIHNSTEISDKRFIFLYFNLIDNKENDIREVKWGDTIEDVMKIEGMPNESDENDMYVFKDKLDGIRCNVTYSFADNKLVSATYVFTEKHNNKYNYIKDYDKLQNLLTLKYGSPFKYDRSERDKDFDPMLINKGIYVEKEVEKGSTKYDATWHEDKTNIRLSIFGKGGEINTIIHYESNKYLNLIKQKEAEEEARRNKAIVKERDRNSRIEEQKKIEKKKEAEDILRKL